MKRSFYWLKVFFRPIKSEVMLVIVIVCAIPLNYRLALLLNRMGITQPSAGQEQIEAWGGAIGWLIVEGLLLWGICSIYKPTIEHARRVSRHVDAEFPKAVMPNTGTRNTLLRSAAIPTEDGKQ